MGDNTGKQSPRLAEKDAWLLRALMRRPHPPIATGGLACRLSHESRLIPRAVSVTESRHSTHDLAQSTLCQLVMLCRTGRGLTGRDGVQQVAHPWDPTAAQKISHETHNGADETSLLNQLFLNHAPPVFVEINRRPNDGDAAISRSHVRPPHGGLACPDRPNPKAQLGPTDMPHNS